MVSIFNYGFNAAQNAFKAAGVEYYSLTNYSVLISLALEKGNISVETEKILLQWREDPANWAGLKSNE